MGFDATWNLVGIPPDARDAARAAALREGLSIGEWLTRRILKNFSDIDFHEQEQSLDRLGGELMVLSKRLQRVEGRAEAEPMREAVKVLHQGLSRLNDDLVKSAGHSAIQISTLSDKLAALNEKLTQLDAGQPASEFEARVSRVQQNLDGLNVRHDDALRTFDDRMSGLAKKLEDAKSRASGISASLEQRIVHLQRSLEGLDTRHGSDERTWNGKFETLTGGLEKIGADSAGRCSALDQRLALVQKGLEQLDARQSAESRSWAGKLENLGGGLEAVRTESASRYGALDQGLSGVRQKLENLDARADELSRTLTGKLESFAETLSGVRAETSGTVAVLEKSVAAVHEHLTGVDARQNDTVQMLTRNLESLGQKLEDVRSLASGASTALEMRGAQIQQSFDLLDRRQNDGSRALSEMRDREAANLGVVLNLEESVAQLKSQISGLAGDGRLVALERSVGELASRAEAIEHGLSALRANPVGNLGTSAQPHVTEATDTQQPAAADQTPQNQAAMAEAPPEASRETFGTKTLPAHDLTANAESKPAAAELGGGPLGEALRTLGEKLQISPTETAEPMVALKLGDEAHANDDREPQAGAGPLPPFPDVHKPASASLDSGAPAERAPAIAAFSRSDTEASPASHTTYLSAARQSLQAAVAHADPGAGSPGLFGLHFFDAERAHAEQKSLKTSYALVAAIILVAVLAVAIAAGEWLSRSAPTPYAGAPNRPAASALHKANSGTRPGAPARKPGAPRPGSAQNGTPFPASTGSANARTAIPADLQRIAALANAGEARAQLILGLHELGQDGGNANPEEAAKWLERAAEQGEPIAQYRIAAMYAQGRGVSVNQAKAFHWYDAAAQAGNRKSMFNLAVDYAQGSGTAKNAQEAVRWFSKAAELGLVDAQFDLAILYERGLGVPQSLLNAYRWYTIAARSGDKESKDRIDAISSQLSAGDRGSAEAAAAAFKPAPMNAEANEPEAARVD
ncbi:MAG TPA: hypothetical protein VGI20_08735 [Rhizomicrobium sp.]|jgi:localization factor PodJL